MAELDKYTTDIDEQIDTTPEEEVNDGVSFNGILETDNIATILSDVDATDVVQNVLNRYNIDYQSRAGKIEVLKKIVKLAISQNEYKDFPWPGASSVIIPLISTAAYEFNAKSYPEIFNDGYIVKPKIYGNDDGEPMVNMAGEPMVNPQTSEPFLQNVGAKLKAGNRVATYLNWQLNEEIENWEEDCDKLLIALPTVGTMFKKTYPDFEGNPCVDLIYPDKIIINDFAVNLKKTPVSHLIEYYPQEVIEKIRSSEFIDFDYDIEKTDASTIVSSDLEQRNSEEDTGSKYDSGTVGFLEQCCWLDLDKDGYPEPYTAMIHLNSSTLVKLNKRFYKENVKRNKEGKIQNIVAEEYYVKYGFLPSPDGSFYDLGFGHLLFNTNSAINSLTNQLIDAGTLQNLGGGFIAKSMKITGGAKTIRQGQWNIADNMGAPMKDAIVPLPAPTPSQTLFAMLSYLIEAGKELAALRDIVSNDAAGAMAPTVMMALSEQSQKHFRAIFKRIQLSLKKEFKKILDINRQFPNLKKYAKALQVSIDKVDVKRDLEEGKYSIVPVADLNSLNNTSRLAQAALLKDFIGNPNLDQMLLLKKIFSPFNIDEIDKLVIPQPPQPPSADQILAQVQLQDAQNKGIDLQIKQTQAAVETEKARYEIQKMIAEIEKIRAGSIESLANAEAVEKGLQLKEYDAVLKNMNEKIRMQGEEDQREIQRESLRIDKESKKETEIETNNKNE